MEADFSGNEASRGSGASQQQKRFIENDDFCFVLFHRWRFLSVSAGAASVFGAWKQTSGRYQIFKQIGGTGDKYAIYLHIL